jgi:hypothetical protein
VLLEDRDPVRCAAVVRGIASHRGLGTVGGDIEGQQEYGEDNKMSCGRSSYVGMGSHWVRIGLMLDRYPR